MGASTRLAFLLVSTVVPVHVISELVAALWESHKTLRTSFGQMTEWDRIHSTRCQSRC
jgi:hypothetical protein